MLINRARFDGKNVTFVANVCTCINLSSRILDLRLILSQHTIVSLAFYCGFPRRCVTRIFKTILIYILKKKVEEKLEIFDSVSKPFGESDLWFWRKYFLLD